MISARSTAPAKKKKKKAISYIVHLPEVLKLLLCFCARNEQENKIEKDPPWPFFPRPVINVGIATVRGKNVRVSDKLDKEGGAGIDKINAIAIGQMSLLGSLIAQPAPHFFTTCPGNLASPVCPRKLSPQQSSKRHGPPCCQQFLLHNLILVDKWAKVVSDLLFLVQFSAMP